MPSRIVSILDNQSLKVLEHDKTEVISHNRKIRKNSILSCVTHFTVTTARVMITVFTPSVRSTWLILADTAVMSCSSVFSFTSFVNQCWHPHNNICKSKQNLCRLRRFCYATEWLLCLGKRKESVWVGSTKRSMLSAGCRWSKITYPLVSRKSLR